MFKWFSNILAETNSQGRAAFRVALAILGITILSAPIYSYIYSQTLLAQLSGIISANFVLGLAMVFSAVLAWDNRYVRAVDIIVAGIGIFAVFIVSLFSGLGLVLSISIFIFALTISGQTLTNKEAPRALLISLGLSSVALIGDFFIPWTRLSLPLLSSTITYIVVIILLLQGLRTIGQFASYSLRSKLIILIVGVSVISIGLVAFVANRVVSDQLNESLGENLATIAQNNATQVSDFLEQNYDRISIFALNKSVQDSVDAANQEGTSNLVQLSELNFQWKNSSDTSQFVRSTQNNSLASALRELKIYYPDIEEVLITDRYGAVIAATDRASDYYVADKVWWQGAWNNGSYISQPTPEEIVETNADTPTTINAINIAIAVSGHNRNETIGVLQATINLDRMNAILAANRFGNTGRANLIFRPFEKFINGDQGAGLNILSDEALASIDAISGTTATMEFENASSLVSTAQIQSENPRIKSTISGLNWVILVHQDLSEVQGALIATSRTITLLAFALVLAVGFMAYFLGNQFTRPIEDLTSTATLIAQGDLYARAGTEAQDEIGTLARALNSMSAQVRELVGTLEQRVADRTKALEISAEVSRRLSTILDEKQLTMEVVQQVKNAFEYYHAQIYLINEKTGDLILSRGTGEAGQALVARGHKLAKGTGLVGRAAETNTIVLVKNTAMDPSWLSNPLLPDTKSEIAVPIALGPIVLGVLDVQQDSIDGLQETDADTLRSIANQVAVALQNARSYADTQQRAEREAMITSINQKILNENTVESALQVAVREVGRVLRTQAKVKMVQKDQRMEK
ncbi:MAG: GAF domain-containing protein [Anaerolineales bacterium]|nr:GAF domain-containing protein [Anaerolineales bacterium]